MSIAFYQTENAVFEILQKDIDAHMTLLTEKHDFEERSKLSVLLDLISAGKGTAICKVCGKTYKANQLKPTTVGHGKNPFEVQPGARGGAKGLFTKKKKIPMFGGKGYVCPAGHELISMITWRT